MRCLQQRALHETSADTGLLCACVQSVVQELIHRVRFTEDQEASSLDLFMLLDLPAILASLLQRQWHRIVRDTGELWCYSAALITVLTAGVACSVCVGPGGQPRCAAHFFVD